MTEPAHLIAPKQVLDFLKEKRTEWREVQSFFSARYKVSKTERIAPSLAAELGGIDVALWAMNTAPPETDPLGRQLCAAFAYGADGDLAEVYKAGTGGCGMLDEGISVLMAWIEGDVTDEGAKAMRWRMSLHAEKLKPLPRAVIDTLGCGFVPKAWRAWGACCLAHEYALGAAAMMAEKTTKELVVSRTREYHLFLIKDLLG